MKKLKFIFYSVLLIISLLAFVSGDTSSYTYVGNFNAAQVPVISSSYSLPQTYSPSFSNYYTSSQISTYWPIFSDKSACNSRQDFMIQILPGGCSPAVVTSDLLAEQDVPVFCQLSATKLNPAIDVKSIDSIGFKGSYPPEVSGVSFHPARAAIQTTGSQLLGSPVLNNIGYVVILLKRNEIEANLSKTVSGNLTAVIQYDIQKAFGVGNSQFVLKQMSDDEWQRDYKGYSFWQGKGYLRLENLYNNQATIGIYQDATHKFSTVTLNLGKTSDDIYLPSSYCQVALDMNLNSIDAPKTNAKLVISGTSDEEDVVYQGSRFLNGACTVQSITPTDIGGSVKVSCNGQTYALSIGTNNQFNFAVGGDQNSPPLRLWDSLQGYTLAYYSKLDPRVAPSINSEFVVFVKPKSSLLTDNDKSQIQNAIASAVQSSTQQVASVSNPTIDSFVSKVTSSLSQNSLFDQKSPATILIVNQDGGTLGGTTVAVKFLGAAINENTYPDSSMINSYFSNAKDSYNSLVNSYPSEKESDTDTMSYGERGVLDAINLAFMIGKGKEAIDFINLAKSVYAGTTTADTASQKETNLQYSGLNSTAGFYLGTNFYFVQLESINQPSQSDASAFISIGATDVNGKDDASIAIPESTFTLGSYIYSETLKQFSTTASTTTTTSSGANSQCLEYIKLNDLKDDSAIVSYRAITYSGGRGSCNEQTNVAVKLDQWQTLGRFRIDVKQINLNKVASVSLSPKILSSTGDINFSFNIGIEKRAIQLSPDQINEKIKNLNDTINKWQNIDTKLGDLVSGMKTACLATSAYVIAKNLMTDFVGGSGDALARNQVMRGSGGWVQKCESDMQTNPDKYKGPLGGEPSLDRCLSMNSAQINSDVSSLSKIMEDQNTAIKSSWNGVESNNGVFDDLTKENVVDSKKAALVYYQSNTQIIDGVLGTGNNGQTVPSLINNSQLGIDDLRDIVTAQQEIAAGGTLEQIGKATLTNKQSYLNDLTQAAKNQNDLTASLSKYGFSASQLNQQNNQILEPVGSTHPYVSPITLTEAQAANLDSNNKCTPPSFNDAGVGVNSVSNCANLKAGDKVIFYTIPGSMITTRTGNTQTTSSLGSINVVVKLKQQGDSYTVDKAYNPDTGEDVTSTLNNALNKANIVSFKQASLGDCINNYKKPEVQFYESGTNQGYPAIVPVDTVNGWYAATKQSTGTFGNIKAYTDAGQIQSFYLCNVGKNGVQEFNSGGRDDICTMINLQTGQPTDELGCVSKAQATNLVNKAIQDLYSAAQQYGKSSVIIDGKAYQVGKPAANIPSTECQDFMSPGDCSLLFNVCDPVICPSSRCDLGGEYPVADVVQSGIIGSLVLCLPNFGNPTNGGVAIPVCLSGLYAGLQSYISILNSSENCLQENLNDGKMIGICDEITSIYTCNFFWGQIAPIMQAIIPKLVSLAYGQGTRGGGEYATVTAAWNNAQSSIDYMKNVYGANAYKAFQARSITDVGTEVCQSFVGTSFPTDWSSFTQPDNPVQFTAYFSEETFTEATVPPTSHYKVYYHIYAGTDQGAGYEVYMKEPPTSSYYNPISTITVDTGYLGKGETADQTKDFTAPSGYQQLCVNINGQESCGFKQVSSSFALGYANSAYMASQASQTDINSEASCISGTSSAYSLLQPNLQAAANDIVNPNIYNNGIIRMCSTLDPGYSTDATQNLTNRRWQKVGWCEQTSNVSCWIDTDSVKNVIADSSLLNSTLTDIYNNVTAGANGGDLMTPEATTTLLSQITDTSDTGYGAFLANIVLAKDIATLNQVYMNAISSGGVLSNLDIVITQGYLNQQKAQALFLKAEAYHLLTQQAYWIYKASITTTTATTTQQASSGVATTQPVQAATTGFSVDSQRNILQGGNPTNFYLQTVATSAGMPQNYLIMKKGSSGLLGIGATNPKQVGNILKGAITIFGGSDGAPLAGLNDYTFDGSNFVSKTATSKVTIDKSYIQLEIDNNYYNGGDNVYDASGNFVRLANAADMEEYQVKFGSLSAVVPSQDTIWKVNGVIGTGAGESFDYYVKYDSTAKSWMYSSSNPNVISNPEWKSVTSDVAKNSLQIPTLYGTNFDDGAKILQAVVNAGNAQTVSVAGSSSSTGTGGATGTAGGAQQTPNTVVSQTVPVPNVIFEYIPRSLAKASADYKYSNNVWAYKWDSDTFYRLNHLTSSNSWQVSPELKSKNYYDGLDVLEKDIIGTNDNFRIIGQNVYFIYDASYCPNGCYKVTFSNDDPTYFLWSGTAWKWAIDLSSVWVATSQPRYQYGTDSNGYALYEVPTKKNVDLINTLNGLDKNNGRNLIYGQITS